MPSPLGCELASSRLLQTIPHDPAAVGAWIKEQLDSHNKAVREEARSLLARHRNDIVAAGSALIWETISDARSSVSSSSSSRKREKHQSAVPFELLHRSIRVALQSGGSVISDVVTHSSRNASRSGSSKVEKAVIRAIDARTEEVLESMNSFLSTSFDQLPLNVRATAVGTNVPGREISTATHFCDLFLRLEFEFPLHGIREVKDVPVNFKAVTDEGSSISAINTGGMRMLAWMMLGDAGLECKSRASLARAVRESFEEGAHVPDSDYVLWVWTKPERTGSPGIPLVIPMLGIDPDSLTFNVSQSWPGIQVNARVTYSKSLEKRTSSCATARKALWMKIQRSDLQKRVKDTLDITSMFLSSEEIRGVVAPFAAFSENE